MGKDVRIAVRVTAIEKEKIQAKAHKCGLSTTEYVRQRALLALKSWASLRIKPVRRSWTRKSVRY